MVVVETHCDRFGQAHMTNVTAECDESICLNVVADLKRNLGARSARKFPRYTITKEFSLLTGQNGLLRRTLLL